MYSQPIFTLELKLFEREGQVLQSLNHPRIPKYRDYFSIDREAGSGLPWFGLVQDYIPGCSLQELLEKGQRFSQEKVKYITIKIFRILIYLHQLSPPVLHRDIKPSNLILGEDNNIYLVDFGAVQAQAHVTGVTFTVVGTSGYAPLEQFWGRAVAASDLYALGATLIHLLTGTPPADLPQKNSRIQFSDRVSLDSSFVRWIEKMTEIALEKRFQTAQEALEALTSPKSPHSSDTKSSMWRQVVRPKNTRIQLQKTSDKLKIQYPRVVSLKYFGLFLLFLYSFSFSLLLITSVSLLWLTVVILIIGSICCFIINNILTDHEKKIIELDHQCLTMSRFRGNRMTYQKNIKISEIRGVIVRNHDFIQYKIMIDYHDQNYMIDGEFGELECIWLAQEIQNWLNSQQV